MSLCESLNLAGSDQGAVLCCTGELQCHSKAKWCFLDLRRAETTEPYRTARKWCLDMHLSSVVVCWVPPWLIAGGSKLEQGICRWCPVPWSACQHTVSQLQSSRLALDSLYPRGLGWHQLTDIEKESGMLPSSPHYLLDKSIIVDCIFRCKGSSGPWCLSAKCEQEVSGCVRELLRLSQSLRGSSKNRCAFPSHHKAGGTWNLG